jgi:hypothetical protein
MTDAEYRKCVADLYDWGAALFREGCGCIGTRQALCRYLNRGKKAGFSQEELIDFLGISSPSVLDTAGCDAAQAEVVMSMLGTLSDEEILGAQK